MIRCLASLHGVRPGAVPPLQRYYQGTVTSCRPSRRTSLPSLGGTTVARHRSLPPDPVRPGRPGVVCPVSPAGNCRGDDRISQVPGEPPLSVCACSSTPAGLLAPDHLRSSSMAPATETTKAPAMTTLSKLNSMAFGLAVYASPGLLPHPTQDSLPAAGQALPDGLSTRRVPLKGFKDASYILSPFPKLAWRNSTSFRSGSPTLPATAVGGSTRQSCSRPPFMAGENVAPWSQAAARADSGGREKQMKVLRASANCCIGGYYMNIRTIYDRVPKIYTPGGNFPEIIALNGLRAASHGASPWRRAGCGWASRRKFFGSSGNETPSRSRSDRAEWISSLRQTVWQSGAAPAEKSPKKGCNRHGNAVMVQ